MSEHVPRRPQTALLADALYLRRAQDALGEAASIEPQIQAIAAEDAEARRQEAEILAKYESDPEAAYDELEPLYIGPMEHIAYETNRLYGPFLGALATTQIMCAACLEAHVNACAAERLGGSDRVLFDRLPLEGKWMFLPRLLGGAGFDAGAEPFQTFAKLIKYRNALVHYRRRRESWLSPGVPTYLEALGLTMTAGTSVISATREMIRSLAALLGEEQPAWLDQQSVTYFDVTWDP